MARRAGSENDLIKCEYCGEMYSVTYKHCPFCNEDGTSRWDDPVDEEEYEEYEEYEEEADYEDEEPRKGAGGGKRLAGGGGGGSRGGRGRKPGRRDDVPIGRIIGTVLSLALIVAAVCIVASIAKSIFGGKAKEPPKPSGAPTPPIVSNTVESPEGSEPVESETPSVQPTVPAVTIVEPTGFKLNKEDITFFSVGEPCDLKVIVTPADATAPMATWSSSNPNIAAVAWNGHVTAVGKGTCTITATVEGLGSQSCIVRCNFKDSGSSTTTTQNPSTSTTPSTDLTLSRSDFTLAFEGDKWQLKVSGTSSTVTWASSNANVATVSSDGTVVAVGKGTCNVTATVDGVTLKCIVRCNW